MADTLGRFYGLGIGPGDPKLVTVRAAEILGLCPNLFVPKSRESRDSLALEIVKPYTTARTVVRELVFPMTKDPGKLETSWRKSAREVVDVLQRGEDACFITLGDALLYSTYIYLARAIRAALPGVEIETVPGVTSFSAAAALTSFPVGEGADRIAILPVSDNVDQLRPVLEQFETVVLMKVAKNLPRIIDLLADLGLTDNAVFVAKAGQEHERIETDLLKLRGEGDKVGYLATILVNTRKGQS